MSGFFGSVSRTDCVHDVFYGTDYHSHLGTKRGGMVVYSPEKGFQRTIHSLEEGYFRNKFESVLIDFSGNLGMGVISDTEPQPILMTTHMGRFAVATVSRIVNIAELEQRCLKQRRTFSEMSHGSINPTELVAMLIAEADTLVSGIENVYALIKGSCSILILTEDSLVATRDKLGRTPIVIGRKDGAYAAAFETCAFPNMDFENEKFLGPGEVVRITAEGCEQLREPNNAMQICAFLWVYFGYPPSFYEGVNVDECRFRCGQALAQNDTTEADFVAGVPDSGIGHAYGYSSARGIPIKRPYAKYTPTWPRSFMPQSQQMRDLVAKMKLIPNESVIKGKRGIFLDDSIVRGTQLKDNTRDLHEAGMKEVHMRIACPPLTYPCEFLNFSRSRSNMDLATHTAIGELEGTVKNELLKEYSDPDNDMHHAMVEQIRKRLGLTTLRYQKLCDLVSAIGLPKERLCTHCWDGSSYF